MMTDAGSTDLVSGAATPILENASMCGIVAYIGNKQVQPLLLEGLKRLEYRGYDSAGVASIDATPAES